MAEWIASEVRDPESGHWTNQPTPASSSSAWARLLASFLLLFLYGPHKNSRGGWAEPAKLNWTELNWKCIKTYQLGILFRLFPPLPCALTRKKRQNVSVTAQRQEKSRITERAKRTKDNKRIFITGVCLWLTEGAIWRRSLVSGTSQWGTLKAAGYPGFQL